MRAALILLISLATQIVMAGAPGHMAQICESESGRTKLTIIDTFVGGRGVTMLLAIDDNSALYTTYDESEGWCEDDCDWIDVSYVGKTTIYSANAGDYVNLKVEIEGGAGIIRKGFVDPRDYSIFDQNIFLQCKSVEEQI